MPFSKFSILLLLLIVSTLQARTVAPHSREAHWRQCPVTESAKSQQVCSGIFEAADAFEDCLYGTVSIADCANVPAITFSGCLPTTGDAILGTIVVSDEYATISHWSVVMKAGIVEVELIDLM